MGIYACDFETTTDIDDCRVWAIGIYNIETEQFHYGNNIDFFFNYSSRVEQSKFYFHNLKFDGSFILSYLLKNNYTYVKDKKINKNQFTTLISDRGVFYSIKICFSNGCTITILDSLKILPFKVSQISKAFNLTDEKLEIDYKKTRPINYQLTLAEIKYLKNDTVIVGKALKILFEQGLKKMTQGSNALADYKMILGKKQFKRYFPPPYYHEDVKKAYKGGYTYLNPKYKERIVGKGVVLDVNSLYPSVMYKNELPYGEPIYFEGKYKPDNKFSLYVQRFTCHFELKKGYLPTIQIKNSFRYVGTEYLTDSKDEDVTLTLTNIDMDLFFTHYNVYNIQFHDGYKFKSTNQLFTDYIDKWIEIKITSEKEGNSSMRTLAKLMLNSLYGKFGTNPRVQSKFPYLEEDIVKYHLHEEEFKKPLYIPVAAFVTAHARYITISSAQKNYDRFIYADTDSLHLEGEHLPDLNISSYDLGAWKVESIFTKAKFIRAKTYIEQINNELKVTVAGMPTSCHEFVTFDNFNVGQSYGGKLRSKVVNGGTVLLDTLFTIN